MFFFPKTITTVLRLITEEDVNGLPVTSPGGPPLAGPVH